MQSWAVFELQNVLWKSTALLKGAWNRVEKKIKSFGGKKVCAFETNLKLSRKKKTKSYDGKKIALLKRVWNRVEKN